MSGWSMTSQMILSEDTVLVSLDCLVVTKASVLEFTRKVERPRPSFIPQLGRLHGTVA